MHAVRVGLARRWWGAGAAAGNVGPLGMGALAADTVVVGADVHVRALQFVEARLWHAIAVVGVLRVGALASRTGFDCAGVVVLAVVVGLATLGGAAPGLVQIRCVDTLVVGAFVQGAFIVIVAVGVDLAGAHAIGVVLVDLI